MADYYGSEDFSQGQLQVGARRVSANGALAIAPTDTVIILDNSSDAATKAATITAPSRAISRGGPRLTVILKARSNTGSYTIACSNAGSAGTVTLDAALEGAEFAWINGTLNLVQLLGTATFA